MKRILVVLGFGVMVLPVMAEVAGGAGVASPGTQTSAFVALIPVAVPVLVALLRMLVPNIPKAVLPVAAILMGAGADLALHYAGVASLGLVWGGVLGAAGIGLRELADQARKQLMPSPTEPAAPTPAK